MESVVKRELQKWKESLEVEELSEYDVTVVNIILNNFDELNKSGIAYGTRNKKFANFVEKKGGNCDNKLRDIYVPNSKKVQRIKRIKSLEVESFRGFAQSREFNLHKRFVFLYGPNGSGKTSFSEAIEYALLGNIQEANVSRIKTKEYIKNTSTNKGINPVLQCEFENGDIGEAEVDYERYKFSFIEKNRISDFSRISGETSSIQTERMAALFGLSEFYKFVKGFSKSISEKYLMVDSQAEQDFEKQKGIRDSKNNELIELKEDLKALQIKAEKSLVELSKKNSSINNLKSAIDYYDNNLTGVLTNCLKNKDKNTLNLIKNESYNEIKENCEYIMGCLTNISSNRSTLANKAMEVSYKDLFEIISTLKEDDCCPACRTPLEKVCENPFVYARKQLREFKDIDELKNKIKEEAKRCHESIRKLHKILENNMELLKLVDMQLYDVTLVSMLDVEQCGENIDSIKSFCERFLTSSEKEIRLNIDKYNNNAKRKNEEIDEKLEQLKQERNNFYDIDSEINAKDKSISKCEEFIKRFDEDSKAIKLKIEEERRISDYNRNIIQSYEKIIGILNKYAEEQPLLIANELAEKAVIYYNQINSDDADFEKLSHIQFPTEKGEKLIVTFMDDKAADALQVLSEGHVKILGLAILLAKVVNDKLNFVIFDDIVNAIDDDHRSGVAELIINHDDFKEIQIILSSHGENFINKLQYTLGSSKADKEALVYKLLPADSLAERGVLVEYSDSKTPLDAAKNKLEKNELKDAAAKCRQALECIVFNLWKNLSKYNEGDVSVVMKSPKGIPDLSSLLDGLKKKTSKIAGLEELTNYINEIKNQSNWRILNKGTHYEEDQPEFERRDIKKVLNILISIDESVRNIKIEKQQNKEIL